MGWFQRRITSLFQESPPVMADPEAALEQARRLLQRKRFDQAFRTLNILKANRVRLQDIDYLRARYFLEMGQKPAALEAVKEELRYFSTNQPARALWNELTPKADLKAVDPEFAKLLQTIRPYTMVGEARLWSLFQLARRVCVEDLPGNFAECGVAAGGASALLAFVISRESKRPRLLFSFDTFEGMPPATAEDVHAGIGAEESGWGTGTCAAPEGSLMEVAGKLGVSALIRPVKGLFCDTLPGARSTIGTLAFLHMDGDWYASTRDILHNLFDQVMAGGFIQIDDYGYWEGCRRAVAEFETERGLKFEIHAIDETGVWLQK